MKKIIVLCFLIVAAGNCFGQQITFQKTYGGVGNYHHYTVQQTLDEGFIISGSTLSFGAGGDDVYLIKTDAIGNSLWTKTFGGTAYDDGNSVQLTTDGGYIITGYTESFGAGNQDVYLIKTDANGDSLWTKTFGGIGYEEGYSGQQTADGGYIISGYTYSFGSGAEDVYLIKTDANGNSLWTKTFGGGATDYGYSVQQTTDGGYIITGYTTSFGAGNADVYFIKTNVNGDSLWTKTFGGTSYDWGNSVKQTTDGGYIITGETNSFGAGYYDVYLIKTDTTGNILWTKTFGGMGEDYGHSVQQTTDGGYIITGYSTNAHVYLIKTDANGDTLWTKNFGGTITEVGSSVQQTTDGGYIIIGATNSFGTGGAEIYLIKTDSLGNSGCNEGSTATIVTTPATQVTSPATIVTSPVTIVTTPATITGSGGTVTTLCTTVGINPIFNIQYSIFNISPNPTTNNFTITFPNYINKGIIEIYTVLGKKIYIENIADLSQTEVHLKNIVAGIYFVKLKDGKKEYTQKLIVQ
ncbi:MAG: T9SS type A sorting domain-containing protein [Bacteroidota bacterium]